MKHAVFLRIRRLLVWEALALIVLEAAVVSFLLADVRSRSSLTLVVPVVYLVPLLAFFPPLLLAPFLALGFDAEYRAAAATRTRPAIGFGAVRRHLVADALAMLIAWLGAAALAMVGLAITSRAGMFGNGVFFSASAMTAVFIVLDGLNGLAGAVLWYGLVVAISALLPGRGTAVVSVTGAAFVILAVASMSNDLPELALKLILLLNIFNPFLYFYAIAFYPLLTISAWLIGSAGTAFGVRIWMTRNAPA